MAYQYGQIETVLAHVCGVADEDLGAFKGKLRHLRSLGIPKVEKVGSGSRARFSYSDAIIMRLGLELSTLGVKPRAIASALSQVNPGAIPLVLNPPPELSAKDLYFFIANGLVTSMFIDLKSVLTLADLNAGNSFAAVNISHLVREMDVALAK